MNSTPFTPAQCEALAKLVGISYSSKVNSHTWLFNHNHHCPECDCAESVRISEPESEGPCFVCKSCGCTEPTIVKHYFSPYAPCPLTGGDEADDVWLAPLMRWLVSVDRAHGVGPSFHEEPERAWAANFYHGCFPEYGATATAALLHSCQAAGVQEVVDIFNLSCDTTTAPTEEA